MIESTLKVEDSRDKFELAYGNLMGTPVSVLKILRDGDEYQETEGDRLNISWAMWQESRAAIVVELPEMLDYELLDEKSVKDSIRAAGITVKGD